MNKLKVVDNWMYLTYFFDGRQLDEKKGGDATISLLLKNIGDIQVRVRATVMGVGR